MNEPTPQQIADFDVRYFKREFIEKHGESPVSWKMLDRALARLRKDLMDVIATVLGNTIVKAFAPIKTRIEALEQALEAQKAAGPNLADAFRGGWMPGSVYARGSLTVHDGSLWLALVDSDQKPGATDAWRLVTKKGKDGKDLRP